MARLAFSAETASRTSCARLRSATSAASEVATTIFEDPFLTLDRETWAAGPKAGTADPGFYGRAAFARWGGEEGFDPYAIVSDADASHGTALQISAKYIGERMNVPHYYGNEEPEFQWISGNIQSARSDGTIMRGWRHGYFEARMLFPEHPLPWPAFWFLNAHSILAPATSIEIDVVEHKGFEPHVYGAYLHEWGEPGERHDSSGVTTEPDMTESYNRYGVLLIGHHCVIYFNRRPIRDPATGEALVWTLSRSAEMAATDDVFWPLITLALRSDYAFPDPLLDTDKLTRLRTDYFRVYS
ncbi:glycosyl hydrolase family protein [Paracoccus liaowanqingii]|uniref:Glycosyl hydrolase family protein n=1 Tax=Paracoccus liaowanqingii TaxID=2560053 RepID=A0A4Z1CS47_9RHOB|nr:glycosyl hydrolase family protein [Paracoccus liaowanqingii]